MQQLQQEQQKILSTPTIPPSGSEITVTAATVSSYEAPQDKPSSPSSNIDFLHPLPSSSPPDGLLHPYPGWAETDDHPFETWSAVPTPSVSELPNVSANPDWEDTPSSNWSEYATELDGGEETRTRAHSGSGSDPTIKLSAEDRPTAWASQAVEVHNSPISSIYTLPELDNKELHFSPSTPSPQPPQPPPQPHFVSAYHGSLSPQVSPQSPVFPSPPPHIGNAFVQQSPSNVYLHSRAPAPPPVTVREDSFELTPNIVAKTQKHCRFAISALDYEDVEQARKELRAALALLGG